MTEVQKAYTTMLDDLSNGDGWKDEKDAYRVGNAGVALTVSFLHDGKLNLSHLKSQVPDFTQTELRMALSRLKKNGYLAKGEAGDYRLAVDKDTSIEDGLFWALLANVANGFMARA